VSPAATVGVMSVGRLAENLVHALDCPATGTVNLPALHVTMADLVAAAAAATDADPEQVSWSPDEALEAQFGRFPPLRAERAEALGFRADEGVARLAETALAGALEG
jgi:D-erythronate 2-dehydrogenase